MFHATGDSKIKSRRILLHTVQQIPHLFESVRHYMDQENIRDKNILSCTVNWVNCGGRAYVIRSTDSEQIVTMHMFPNYLNTQQLITQQRTN